MALGTLARRLQLQFDLAWVAKGCRQHFIDLDQRQEDALVQSLVQHYYLGKGKSDPRTSPDLKVDFEDVLYGGVIRNRATVIPWLQFDPTTRRNAYPGGWHRSSGALSCRWRSRAPMSLAQMWIPSRLPLPRNVCKSTALTIAPRSI